MFSTVTDKLMPSLLWKFKRWGRGVGERVEKKKNLHPTLWEIIDLPMSKKSCPGFFSVASRFVNYSFVPGVNILSFLSFVS